MMVPASSSPSSSASSPFDATLPHTNRPSSSSQRRRTRSDEESRLDRSRKFIMYVAILASFFVSFWYMNKGINASMDYHNVSKEVDNWKPAWAVVTGRNMTYPGVSSVGPFLPFFPNNSYYCAILTYETVEGRNVTTSSKANCGEYAADIAIGEEMGILYNPKKTQEVLEKDVVDGSLDGMMGAIATIFAFALGFLICAILLWRKRDAQIGLERHAHRRRMVPRPTVLQDEWDVELAPEELERRKQEREEEVLKHFHFETVSDNGEDGETMLKSTSDDSSQDTESSSSTEASVSQDRHNADCCICMENYGEGDHICIPTTIECNHVFHKSCLLEWLRKHDHCPLCRANLVHGGSNYST